jgi:hypothetical protein
MNRSVDVELQLVMHALEVVDLLRLARCSRRLMRLALTPFAWKYTSALPLRIELDKISSTGSPWAGPLLQLAPISMHWNLRRDGGYPCDHRDVSRLLRLAPPHSTLHDLDIAECIDDAVHWHAILAHPCTRSLRSISIYSTDEPGTQP